MDNQDIADIINRKSDDVPEPVAEQPKQDAPAEDKGNRDDKGRFVSKGDKAEQPETTPQPTGEAKPADAPPAPAQSQPPHGFVPTAALIDQRLEARQAKQERDELRRQLAELQKPKAEPIDPYTDFDGALNQRSQQFVDPIMREVRTLQNELAQLKAEKVFGDKFGEFMTFVRDGMENNDPQVKMLEAMMQASADPYETAKKWFDNRNFDANAERERMRAELLAELRAGGQAPPPTPSIPAAQPVMPSNLAGARNVGTRAGPQWSGPPKLDDIFKR